MIRPSPEIDLGQDHTRIKDPRDGARQLATVKEILSRMFEPRATKRWELQLLADEVGLGKTFVALGTAYSLLAHLRAGKPEADLDGCYQKVLIITPGNKSLFEKWLREVKEFVKRCVKPEMQAEGESWFSPVRVDRLDDLAVALRRPGSGGRILVTHTGIFSGGKLMNYDLKRRFLLGTLFRYWGTRFRHDARDFLLRGAPDDWPRDASTLTQVTPEEQELLSFTEDELRTALERLPREDPQVETLLQTCIELAQPYYRDRVGDFREKLDGPLSKLYRTLAVSLITRDIPLVVVDEAHNWKNGPSSNANGYWSFASAIARRSRRALLLTATPFQLRPQEMLELFRVSDDLKPCPTLAASDERRERLRSHREDVIAPVLRNTERASRRFARAWTRLPRSVTTELIAEAWACAPVVKAKAELDRLAAEPGALPEVAVLGIARAGADALDPALREMIRDALALFAFNSDLSAEMSQLVIRHRRRTLHRAFRVGQEYAQSEKKSSRPDLHLLHGAEGLDVRGEGELPHYLLMRCVSEMKQGKGRSSLGSALTGCYSTLKVSAEGKDIDRRLRDSPLGSVYLDLLGDLVGERNDPHHPKVAEVVSPSSVPGTPGRRPSSSASAPTRPSGCARSSTTNCARRWTPGAGGASAERPR